MELKIIESSKEEMKVEFDNLTLPELLRVYLNKDSSVKLAVWKRNHPNEKPALLVKTKGKTAKKAVDDAVKAIVKDLDRVEADFKKLK
ncbi:MAG: RpoL/Rpb11 RNA polymerase subunit family protein [Nanoarchaeota archaeon]|nr:RpoL/Rpb11 RNA polymerase subunit family protein [Nanoarchaeota archaeon]